MRARARGGLVGVSWVGGWVGGWESVGGGIFYERVGE